MKWNKTEFEKVQQKRFEAILLPLPFPFHDDTMPVATIEIIKMISKDQDFHGYVNDLLHVCTQIVDEKFTREYCESVLEAWREEINSKIVSKAIEYERLEQESKMPASILKKESKSLKPEILKWIRAYESLLQLKSFHAPTYGNVSWCRYEQTVKDICAFKEFSSSDLIAEIFKKSRIKENRPRIYARNKVYFTESGDPKIYNEIRIEILNHGTNDEQWIEMDLTTYSRLCAQELIKDLIVIEATERHGESGRIVATWLLDRTLYEQRPAPATKSGSRGRPANDFVNKLMLDMDAKKIDKSKIRLLVDALTARENRIYLEKSREANWDVKRRTFRNRANVNAEKSIAKQVRELGGNLLKYLADESVRKHRQCEQCDWRWSPQGELTRAIPCAKHKGLQEKTVIDRMHQARMDDLIRHRGRDHFANALSGIVNDKATGTRRMEVGDMISRDGVEGSGNDLQNASTTGSSGPRRDEGF